MATASTRMILLPVVLFLVTTVHLGHGDVLVENFSKHNVSVFDTNTTVIIDHLEPGHTTSFPMDTAGPDLFVVTNEYNARNITIPVKDGCELYLHGSRTLTYTIHFPNSGPTAAPSSNSVGATAGG